MARLSALVLIALAVLAARGAAATPIHSWHIVGLGTLGGAWSEPAAVNEREEIAGDSETRTVHKGQSASHAFLWSEGAMHDLGTLAGDVSVATAINESGHVVGWSTIHSGQTAFEADVGPHHAFLWQHGRMIDLGTLGGAQSEAVAINDRDQVVGWSDLQGSTVMHERHHAFLWENGRMRDLGTLGGRESEAFDINDKGLVVGWSDIPGSDHGRAFLWEHGTMRDLGLTGAGVAINERGQVLGISDLWVDHYVNPLQPPRKDRIVSALALNEHGDAAGLCIRKRAARPCAWLNGKALDLGILATGTRGRALALNDNGLVVGRTGIGKPSGKSHAFAWQHGKLVDLRGLRRTDWSEASAVTNSGLIVGISKRAYLSSPVAVAWMANS